MDRLEYSKRLKHLLKTHCVVAILGPRQCGKTTLARQFKEQSKTKIHDFDLENPRDLSALNEPMLALENLKGVIIIDEIQRRPELFPVLRVLVDRPKGQQRFLILGSASRDLIQQFSETLAGRIAFLELTPFSGGEVSDLSKLWLRGGYPRSFLAKTLPDSVEWRQNYIMTFLERDIPNLGIRIPSLQLRRFWNMLAHYHGQITNFSEIGRSLNLSHPTVRHYLEILAGTFMVRILPPFFENIAKRQVKMPKIYFRDSGLWHTLLELNDQKTLYVHPKLGASWEGFALEEVIRVLKAEPAHCFFWRTHTGTELDLMILNGSKRLGFEFKYQDAPTLTSSMQLAYQDLRLTELTVIYPGEKEYALQKNIVVKGLSSFLASPRAGSGV